MIRRGFLATTAALLGAAIAGGFGLLATLFAKATSRWPARHATRWTALCKLSDLRDDAPFETSFTFERFEGWYREKVARQVYVTRDAQGAPVVFSRTCTHLGCPVKWKAQSKTFRCACHGGVFDASGSVVEGPPPRALDRLPCRIAGELIEVEEA
ncbi:MAG: ubiquinol-cytochrome c reductase iron-sulfur subunit [Planctomycetes bacterium]|nr:ubiquinol-cytochrome c reductase iron-sulfur subunit [Planctomycetota bacterium]